jgi:hypothetical protein
MIGDAGRDIAQVGFWVEFIELGGFDKGVMVARRHDLNTNLLFSWRRQLRHREWQRPSRR